MATPSKAWVCGRSLAGIYGFESSREHGCLSLVSVVCFQVEVSASADHSSRGVFSGVVCVTECGREASIMRRPWSIRGCCAMSRKVTDFLVRLNRPALQFVDVS